MIQQHNSMEPNVKVVNGVLMCCKEGHNEKIMMVDMEKETQISDRLLCEKCFKDQRIITKYSNIDQVLQQIQEKHEGINSSTYQKQEYSTKLTEFQDAVSTLKSQFILLVDELYTKTALWIKEVNSLKIEHTLHTFVEDLKSLISNEEDSTQKQLKNINKSHYTKIQQCLRRLIKPDYFQSFFDKFSKLTDKLTYGKIYETQKTKIRISEVFSNIIDVVPSDYKVKLIKSIKQKEHCGAIAFNRQGNLFITGCDNQIKVWKFDREEIVCLRTLGGHENQINYLVFSKKSNWFVSGSSDSTIRCWQEKDTNNWITSSLGKQHREKIFCIVMNSNEDQLITCSFDKQILIWKINPTKNSLQFDYALEQKHILWIYCISLNPSETALVSCGGDKKIVLWMKSSNQKWTYKTHLEMEDFGYRLSFINDNEFVWLQQGAGILHILGNNSGILIQKSEQKLEKNQSCKDGIGLFPIVVDKRRDLLILKHSKFIYLIKLQNQLDKLDILGEPIDCGEQSSFGALNGNGDLIIGNNENKELKWFQLIFQ